jgi:hypothetical protein
MGPGVRQRKLPVARLRPKREPGSAGSVSGGELAARQPGNVSDLVVHSLGQLDEIAVPFRVASQCHEDGVPARLGDNSALIV